MRGRREYGINRGVCGIGGGGQGICRYGPVVGPELWTYATSLGSGWTENSTHYICDGTQSSYSNIYDATLIAPTTGRSYIVRYVTEAVTAGTIHAMPGGYDQGTQITSNEVVSEVINVVNPAANDRMYFQANVDFEGSILKNSISVREVI